jgi:hypothetical protein
MASEDVFDMSVRSEGSNAALGEKLLGLWSHLNEHLSPEAKSHLKDMMEQYRGLDDSKKKDFEENLKHELSDRFTSAVRNDYLSELMNSTLVGFCAATIFLVFDMHFAFKYFSN